MRGLIRWSGAAARWLTLRSHRPECENHLSVAEIADVRIEQDQDWAVLAVRIEVVVVI